MKILFSFMFGALFAAGVVTSAHAGCSHGYQSADMSELKIVADEKKTNEAMSTHDSAKVDALLDAKTPVQEVEVSE